MTKEEIIKALRDMARYPTVTLPRDSEALKVAADLLAQPDPYAKGYADAMNWKVQNHLEHLPAAQPEQEPVAWYYKEGLGRGVSLKQETFKWIPLYTIPPQRKPLTDEEIKTTLSQLYCDLNQIKLAPNDRPQKETVGFLFARAIEAAHGIKETEK